MRSILAIALPTLLYPAVLPASVNLRSVIAIALRALLYQAALPISVLMRSNIAIASKPCTTPAQRVNGML